jgi:hypothetical protein
MAKINTLEDLRAEQRNLAARRVFLEGEMKAEFAQLKADLEPLVVLTNGAKKLVMRENGGILGNSFGWLAGEATKKFFVRNAGFLTRMIVPYLVKTTTGNIVEENKSKIAGWIGTLISKFTRQKTAEE